MGDKKNLHPLRLTTRSTRDKAINKMHYLYSFCYCHIFPNRRHGVIIIPLMVQKKCCLSCLKNWRNLLDPDSKRQAVMRMKVDINKIIYPEFGRHSLGGCRDDNYEMPLVYPTMKITLCQLQELPCFILVLIIL